MNLKDLVAGIKAETKAETSASATLKKIIDDYLLTDAFRDYLATHREDAPKYLPEQGDPPGRFRASSAGKCLQQQCFKAVAKLGVRVEAEKIVRPAKNARALLNGTFSHIRWHMIFDALHERKLVETLAFEVRSYNEQLQMTGAFDRLVRFPYGPRIITMLIDFKTIKSYGFANLTGAQPDHAAQQHAYELLNGYGADKWTMLYEDKDTQEIKIIEANYDPFVFDGLRKKYALGNAWVDAVVATKTIMGHSKLPLQTDWCNWCDYQKTCGEVNG